MTKEIFIKKVTDLIYDQTEATTVNEYRTELILKLNELLGELLITSTDKDSKSN